MKRRQFIRTIGSGSLSLVAASGFSRSVFQGKKKLGVALVGLGYYSTDLLAPALTMTKYCELRGIVTGSPEKVPVWQRQYGIPDSNVYDYGNMHTIANNDDIDVIYIVLPTGLHSKYSIIAAEAGKHVWCEKPMARTAEECTAIIESCHKNKVYLSIGYRMQHEPNTQTIIGWASSKPYGNITSLSASAGYREGRRDHWKLKRDMGGGAMYDMGVYPLNAVRYSTGMEPIAVTARYETDRPEIFNEVDETTYFDLEFPGGVKASCFTSLGKSMNNLHVDCEKGWYELSPFQAYSGIRGQCSDGTLLNASVPNQQARQMDDDALSILNKTQVLVPGEEGRRDIAIVEAIHHSARNNSELVSLR